MEKGSRIVFVALLAAVLAVGLCALALADGGLGRSILKMGGLAGAFLGIIGIGAAGYAAGQSFDSHTGWERYTHGAGQFFNRKPFERVVPTYGVTENPGRLNWVDSLANRMGVIRSLLRPSNGGEPQWAFSMGPEKLPEPLKSYFGQHKDVYENTLKAFPLMGQQAANWEKFKDQFAIADAWSVSMASSFRDAHGQVYTNRLYPPEPQGPPEEWDFRGIRREKPLPFKSPRHAAQLLKKVTHTFGATLVGITKLNPDWCYQGNLRGVGWGDWQVPSHWEYAIVIVTPHEWDSFYANPTYGTSYDAYSRERMIGGRLEAFLHELGYPARAHVPPYSYDMVMPPVAIDAGLGEQARNGLLITPELGSNARLACVTTNVPLAVDKPVDLGVADFCRKCKICAEKCPIGAISYKEQPGVVRGYRRWEIKHELCFHTWASVATRYPRGCRICLEVCPYTRKNNWLHALSRDIDPRDPTGMVSSALLWMQRRFFVSPKAQDYMPPPAGKNATYHTPPDWLQTDKWFDVPKTIN